MKWFVVPAFAASCIVSAAPAAATTLSHAKDLSATPSSAVRLAQADRHDRDSDRRGERDQGARPPPAQMPRNKPQQSRPEREQQRQPQRVQQHQPIRQTATPRERTRQTTTRREESQRTTTRREETRQRYDWQKYTPGQLPPDWRRHRSYDSRTWQRNYRADHRYRWVPYQRPPGWVAWRWTFGTILPSQFWVHQYWIIEYWQFGLPDPPYGYVWVRYGDDALLVNVHNGYILQVVYDLFY